MCVKLPVCASYEHANVYVVKYTFVLVCRLNTNTAVLDLHTPCLGSQTGWHSCSHNHPHLNPSSKKVSPSSIRFKELASLSCVETCPSSPTSPGDGTLDLLPHCFQQGWMGSCLCRRNPSLNSCSIC